MKERRGKVEREGIEQDRGGDKGRVRQELGMGEERNEAWMRHG